ncbi:hypothetical protein M378DRAFT_182715, partial [Amanita muscaria Koide BX008]
MSESSSDSEPSSASSTIVQSPSAAEEIAQLLSGPTKNKKKSISESKSKPESKSKIERQLEPFLAAARWIPLAIEPFASIRDVLLVGIQGRSGRREEMGKDEQYQCIVFEQIAPLVPNFISVLSEVRKNPDTFDNFVDL